MFGIEFWASFIIVWTVQGKGLNTSIQHGLAEVSTVILQMRLYALYHRSTRLLVFMVIFFAAEVGISLWIMVAMSLINNGSSIGFR